MNSKLERIYSPLWIEVYDAIPSIEQNEEHEKVSKWLWSWQAAVDLEKREKRLEF